MGRAALATTDVMFPCVRARDCKYFLAGVRVCLLVILPCTTVLWLTVHVHVYLVHHAKKKYT
jgi:hypothetical protein